VEGGANIDEANPSGATALLIACSKGKFEIVVYLVEHGANVAHTDWLGMTALHCASLYGPMFDTLPTGTYLLKHGARIAERNNEGATALLHAAEKGNEEVVQYLLSSEGGASIAETDDEGNTALLLAADTLCFSSLVQWLIEFGGAQITDTDKEGKSAWTRWEYGHQPIGYNLPGLGCSRVHTRGVKTANMSPLTESTSPKETECGAQ
jgi:ankyrin repeat protein